MIVGLAVVVSARTSSKTRLYYKAAPNVSGASRTSNTTIASNEAATGVANVVNTATGGAEEEATTGGGARGGSTECGKCVDRGCHGGVDVVQ